MNYGMKWYKFLIYFSLFASAILNGFTAIGYFAGTAAFSAFYSSYPALQFLDILAGLFFVVVAIVSIYTRQALVNYRRIAPLLVVGLYIVNALFTVFYEIVVSVIVGTLTISVMSTALSVGVAVAIGYANYIYFQKRAALFVY